MHFFILVCHSLQFHSDTAWSYLMGQIDLFENYKYKSEILETKKLRANDFKNIYWSYNYLCRIFIIYFLKPYKCVQIICIR